MHFLNTIINNLLNIVFPVKCISCGKTGVDLCLMCLSDAKLAERECAKWIYPLYDYRHPCIKKVLWLLKYKNRKNVANIFAEILYEKILEELSELSVMENFREPILIPIPLSSKRYRERGYNQSELICKELIKINISRHGVDGNGVDFKLETKILIKIKNTEHQAYIKNRRSRLINLSNSFAIKNYEDNKEILKGKNIILIDDIITTGATLSEAKKVLKRAGARKVIAFTVAH